jgi:hypothetical protein
MTGIYVRVKDNNKWVNKEIEFLTDEERQQFYKDKDKEELISWINSLCNFIKGNGAFSTNEDIP